ncbi:2,3-diaminopropionate biosynthesis protein SbnB [Pendulispora albinea]|uniref:2,3-diaminopropionate biosynthesis protein SbnB n=1 Tax=Pendulispora albinea TaxID=2741071 RepID=A0ABZ2MB83_9BACT
METSSHPALNLAIVKGKTCYDIIHGDIPGCIDVVREAYLAHGSGNSVNPPSYFLRFPERPNARIIALPAFLGERFRVSGIKWIASYPDNLQLGIPRASAVLILNDYDTGYPIAVLESSIISAARTAASAVLAAETLRQDKKVRRFGMVGNGLIARYIHRFFRGAGWELDEVVLFDTNPAESNAFEAMLRDQGERNVRCAASFEELLGSCDVAVFATVAATPYANDPSLLAHDPLLLNISLRDLAPELLLASENIVDDVEHVLKANTSPHLTEMKLGHRDFIRGTLADVLQKNVTVQPNKPIVFSPFGLGVLDLAVGKWILDASVANGSSPPMRDFFFEVTR